MVVEVRRSLRLQNMKVEKAEQVNPPPKKAPKKPVQKRTRKGRAVGVTTTTTQPPIVQAEAPGVVTLELLKHEPLDEDDHPVSSQVAAVGLFSSAKGNVGQEKAQVGTLASQFHHTIASVKAEPESPPAPKIDDFAVRMTRRMTRGSRARANESSGFIPDDKAFHQSGFIFPDGIEFGATVATTQNEDDGAGATSTSLHEQPVFPNGTEIIPYRIPQTRNVEKYISLNPSEQVVKLARDLDNQTKTYNVLYETVVSYASLHKSLSNENADLRQDSAKYKEIAEKEKKRAEDLWKKLDMTRLYNKASAEGAEQRHFLSEKYSEAIEKIKRECNQRLKEIELDRTKLAKENQVLNRKICKARKKSKSRVVSVQKGVISSLVRVIGRLLKPLHPQTVKQNIVDIVTKLCGERDGQIFSECFEGNKWVPEDDLVNLICDWMMEAGMDQNEQEIDENEVPAVEPPTKRMKIEQVVIAKVDQEIPPEVSSVSIKDDDDDSEEDDEDFEEVFSEKEVSPSTVSTLRVRFAQDIQEILPVGEGVTCEKMRLENQWKEKMKKGTSPSISEPPNPILKSTTNYKMEDLFGEDANENVPTPNGTHREDFDFDKLNKTCGDEEESSSCSSSNEDEEETQTVELEKEKASDIKPSVEKNDTYAMISNDLDLSDDSSSDEEDSISTQAISSMEGVGDSSEKIEIEFISPASPVGTLDDKNAVGENKCVPVDGGLYQTLDALVNIPLNDLLKNAAILQFPLANTSQQIATAMFALISNTGSSHIQADMLREASLTECPLKPRFASLLAIMRHLMTTYPVKYQNLSAELCRIFCEKITGEGGEKLIENEDLMVHVGRFFGAALKLCEGVDIEAIVVTVGGVKAPYLYSLMYGMLCSDSAGVLNFIQGVSQWEHLDLWVRGVLVTIMRGPSFSHSKWRGILVVFLKTLGVASLVPVDLGYEKYLRGMLKEVAEIESEKALREGGRIIAMMMVQIGWPWLRKAAEGLFEEYEGLWKTLAISDGAFGEVILKSVGIAIAWMRKENTPENLTDMKQLIAKYKAVNYPHIIQVAAGSALELLEKVVLRSPGKPQVFWTYQRTDGGARKRETWNKKKTAEKRKRQKNNRKVRKQQVPDDDKKKAAQAGPGRKVASRSNGNSFDRDDNTRESRRGDKTGTSSSNHSTEFKKFGPW